MNGRNRQRVGAKYVTNMLGAIGTAVGSEKSHNAPVKPSFTPYTFSTKLPIDVSLPPAFAISVAG